MWRNVHIKKLFQSLWLGLIAISIVFLSGCETQYPKIINITTQSNELSFLLLDEFKNRGFIGTVPEYNSEVSVCFEDEHHEKTLMIFSIPIQYINQYDILTPIDTRLTNVTNFSLKQNGYVYQTASCDISAYYPEYLCNEKGIIISNKEYQYQFGISPQKNSFASYSEIKTFINESRHGIIFKNAFGKNTALQSYPTPLGTRNETIIYKKGNDHRFVFWLDAEGYKPKMEPGGYILLISNEKDKDGKDIIVGVIQPPLLKDKAGKLSVNNRLKLEKQDDGRYAIEIFLDEDFLTDKNTHYPLTFDTCFEMRKEKQPDTQVFSGKPFLNQYLSNYTIIGNYAEYEDSRCYIRYQFINEFGLKPEQIKSVNYITYNITNNEQNIDLFRVTDDWCSLTSNWNTKIPYDKKVTSTPASHGVNQFDITDIAKEYATDQSGQLQRNGLLMKSESSKWNILTSHDSSLYPTRIEIVLK